MCTRGLVPYCKGGKTSHGHADDEAPITMYMGLCLMQAMISLTCVGYASVSQKTLVQIGALQEESETE